MPSKCACGCGWLVRAKGHFYGDHATNPPAANTFLAQAQAADRRYNGDENPNYGSAINNPINGPINRKKRKMERRADAEAYLLDHGRTGILSTSERVAIAKDIATDRSLFDNHPDERLHGKSLDDLFADESFCGYIGETMRTLDIEALRWLTKRGSQFHASGKNRPVLAWAPEDEDGQPVLIKESEAKAQLGFRSVFLYKNEEKPNTTFVEDLLQEHYHDLGLPRRLHRRIGMGDNGFGADDEEGATELHKVFLAYSFDVQDAIDAGEVVVVV
jgi:hypothetical protein